MGVRDWFVREDIEGESGFGERSGMEIGDGQKKFVRLDLQIGHPANPCS